MQQPTPRKSTASQGTQSVDLVPRLSSAELVRLTRGIIYQRVLHWYKFLPPSLRFTYDVSDMIGDVILHVYRNGHKYNPLKGKPSTFTFWAAERKCQDIVTHYQRPIRAGVRVTITPELVNWDSHFYRKPEHVYREHAMEAIERTIAYGSDALLDLIEHLLYPKRGEKRSFRFRDNGSVIIRIEKRGHTREKVFPKSTLDELRRKLSYDDIRLVMQNAY